MSPASAARWRRRGQQPRKAQPCSRCRDVSGQPVMGNTLDVCLISRHAKAFSSRDRLALSRSRRCDHEPALRRSRGRSPARSSSRLARTARLGLHRPPSRCTPAASRSPPLPPLNRPPAPRCPGFAGSPPSQGPAPPARLSPVIANSDRAYRIEAPRCVSTLPCPPARCAPPANSQPLCRFGRYLPSNEDRMECRDRHWS